MDSALHTTLISLPIKRIRLAVFVPAATAGKTCPQRAAVVGPLKLHGHNDIKRLLSFRVLDQGATICIVDCKFDLAATNDI